MRRIRIHIPESLDVILEVEAEKRNRSKGSLIRECVSARYGKNVRIADDPLTALIGTVDIDPEDVDDVLYGR